MTTSLYRKTAVGLAVVALAATGCSTKTRTTPPAAPLVTTPPPVRRPAR